MPYKLYMTIDGLKLPSVYKMGVALEACRWGLLSQTSSVGSGAGTGKVQLQDFHFVKGSDAATPALVRAVATGQQFLKLNLLAVSETENQNVIYKLTLSNIQFAAVDTQGSVDGANALSEEFTVRYMKFDVVTPTDNR